MAVQEETVAEQWAKVPKDHDLLVAILRILACPLCGGKGEVWMEPKPGGSYFVEQHRANGETYPLEIAYFYLGKMEPCSCRVAGRDALKLIDEWNAF